MANGGGPDIITISVDADGNFIYTPATKIMATPGGGHTGPSQVQWVGDEVKFVVSFSNSPFQRSSFKENEVATLRPSVTPGRYPYGVAAEALAGERAGELFLDNCPEIDVDC